ncbi:LemA family protein [Candidatus Peregrinibacteria bacterium]|nr:LemA family protein [Candidatus Peregrinibacteria bacterium]
MSKNTKIVLGVIIAVFVLIVGFIWSTYNGIITVNLAADTQWANVETSYQRRWDLLPRLEAALKSAYKQEDAIFGMIAKARTMYAGAKTIDEKVGAVNQLDSAMARLLVIVEQYPQLKSIDVVGQYYTETAGTENRISAERMRFNEAIFAYNLKVQTFPSNIVANMFGFDAREWFKAVTGAETPPQITL